MDDELHALGPAPALIVRPSREPLPAVLWFHGFGVDKETHRKELNLLASAGFAAIGIDAVGHGARRLPDLAERQAAPRDEARATAMELASKTADEVPAILDAAIANGIADRGAIAIAGVSMGAFTVYRATSLDPRIKAAVAILGDPELMLQAAEHVALLSITGERDENVPPHAARELHARRSGVHRYVEIPDAPHLMSEQQWNVAMNEMLEWLTRHLRAALRDRAR